MDDKICSFCGHRNCVNLSRTQIKKEIADLIENIDIKTFYSGGMGDFDTLCESVVRELKRSYDIRLYLIAPYFTQRFNNYKEFYMQSYDDIIIPDLGDIHYKRAIGARNRWIAERSDIILCYVIRDYGGAYQMYRYAQKIGKTVKKLE